MTSKWNYLPLTSEAKAGERAGEAIRQLHSTVSGVLDARRYNLDSRGREVFHPPLRDLHDPFLMPDMNKAVDRINRAMGAKEKFLYTATMM